MSFEEERHFDSYLSFDTGCDDLDPSVLRAMSRPHYFPFDKEFVDYWAETELLLRKLFGTKDNAVVPMIGPVRAGLDMAIRSLVEPGDKILVPVNGWFGELFIELVKECGGEPIVVEGRWGSAIDPAKVAQELDRHKGQIKAVTLTHVETATGVINPAAEIGDIAKKRGLLFIMDCAHSIASAEIKMDEWGADICVGGSSKCMSASTGLAFVAVSKRAWKTMEQRKTPIAGWYSNLLWWKGSWIEKTRAGFSFPATLVFGVREVLDWIFEQGLPQLYERYAVAGSAIREGLMAAGLKLVPDLSACANSVTVVFYPKGVKEKDFRELLYKRYHIGVSATYGPLAGKAFRTGPVGMVQLRPYNVMALVASVCAAMTELGADMHTKEAIEATAQRLETGVS